MTLAWMPPMGSADAQRIPRRRGRRGKELNLLPLPGMGSALPMSYAPAHRCRGAELNGVGGACRLGNGRGGGCRCGKSQATRRSRSSKQVDEGGQDGDPKQQAETPDQQDRPARGQPVGRANAKENSRDGGVNRRFLRPLGALWLDGTRENGRNSLWFPYRIDLDGKSHPNGHHTF